MKIAHRLPVIFSISYQSYVFSWPPKAQILPRDWLTGAIPIYLSTVRDKKLILWSEKWWLIFKISNWKYQQENTKKRRHVRERIGHWGFSWIFFRFKSSVTKRPVNIQNKSKTNACTHQAGEKKLPIGLLNLERMRCNRCVETGMCINVLLQSWFSYCVKKTFLIWIQEKILKINKYN